MTIDWQASKNDFIADVRRTLLPVLRADHRLIGAAKLGQNFDDAVAAWQTNGVFRAVINFGNELAAAAAILDRLAAGSQLHYERRLMATPKSIDFCVEAANGALEWVDVKTIAPGWQDDDAAWDRILRIAADFPAQARLVVHRDLGGAAVAGEALKARWSFVQRAVEFEQKLALLTDAERGPARLLLCSDGAWHEDELEDFADFYATGQFRADDWSQNAVARYMSERGLSFDRSIHGFCFLKRRQDEVLAERLAMDVRGPALGSAA